jgi:exopolyphosphatase
MPLTETKLLCNNNPNHKGQEMEFLVSSALSKGKNHMSPHKLNRYLIESRTNINIDFNFNFKSIDYLVMGNEAADLDSMASSIAYAYILNAMESDGIVVPIMPIVRADFKLRSEAVYVFNRAGIDLNNLIFMDDINFETVVKRAAGLVLVDHNKLPDRLLHLQKKVAIILDHHRNKGLYHNAVKRVIEPVGSTATLVGEELIAHCPNIIDEHLALLLWGTILLDTVNLDPAAGRVTPRDEQTASFLMRSCPVVEQAEYFNKIQTAKFNTANLKTFDLLRKDYKESKSNKISWGIASVTLPLTQWSKRDTELCLEFESHAQRRNLDLLISMNAYKAPGFSRDLVVFCTDKDLHDWLIDFLQKKELELTPLIIRGQRPCRRGKISFYRQGNLGISRKKLTPMLDDYFLEIS